MGSEQIIFFCLRLLATTFDLPPSEKALETKRGSSMGKKIPLGGQAERHNVPNLVPAGGWGRGGVDVRADMGGIDHCGYLRVNSKVVS